MQGLIGRKVGMTQVFDEDGRQVAVTVIEAGPCVVTQRKTAEKDGYDAVQLGFAEQKEHRMKKPALGTFKKVNTTPKRHLKEFALDAGDDVNEGDTVNVMIFEDIPYVDITGFTKGRGFQGVVKRYNMAGGRMTHGGHARRRVGSIGQCSYPARVAKGQRLPGHMGNSRATQSGLKVVAVQGDDNVLLVRGAVPGPNGGILVLRKALRNTRKVGA